jgi:hypothetical protein
VLGPRALAGFARPDVDDLGEARPWHLLSVTPVGDDVRLEYELEDR